MDGVGLTAMLLAVGGAYFLAYFLATLCPPVFPSFRTMDPP
jgi:hypothetical protein